MEQGHSGTVAVEHQGKKYTALYRVETHAITVSTKSAVRSAPRVDEPIEHQARRLLLEMIQAHEAEADQPHT